MNISSIASRDVGQYPLSIATSLAFEGSMGIHPANPDGKVLLPQYEVIWVNLKTIFRNFYRAIDKDLVTKIKPQDLAQGILEEIDSLKSVIQHLTGGRISIQLYVSDYAGMETKYRYAQVRMYTTDLQKQYGNTLQQTLTLVLQALRDSVKMYRLKITDSETRKCLMLTHFAFDLLARSFSQMSLLESHTGNIKNKHQFYTKYHDGKNYQNIPFYCGLMQVFGDSEHFRPMQKSVRDTILAIADKYNWSQVTTSAKVRAGLETIQDPYLRDVLRKIEIE